MKYLYLLTIKRTSYLLLKEKITLVLRSVSTHGYEASRTGNFFLKDFRSSILYGLLFLKDNLEWTPSQDFNREAVKLPLHIRHPKENFHCGMQISV